MRARPWRALGALALGSLVASCGAAGPPGAAPPHAKRCDPEHLDACERAIAAGVAEGAAPRDLVAAYVEARARRDAADPWAKLFRDLDAAARGGARAAVISDGAQDARPEKTAWVRAAALPRPEAASEETLLLALGDAAGHEHLIHVRGARALELYPRDPLAPFVPGIPPIARGDASPARLPDHVAIAALVRRALSAAGDFRYADAAAAADALAAATRDRDPFAEPILRARYALQLLATAGVALEEEEGEAGGAAPAEAPAMPAPAPGDTPYGDYLRIRTAKDEKAAWAARGAAVLAAVPADRRDAVRSLLGETTGCDPAVAPPLEDARDLVFAARLAGALAPEPAASAQAAGAAPAPPGRLPLAAWLSRYEALVRQVDRTKTAWAYAPAMLYERGGALGPSPAGTPTYRRATELGLAHIAALRALAEASPRRYRALSQLPLVYSPGVLADDRLRDAIVGLTQATVQRKLAVATDAAGVFEGAIAGLFAGMSYPAAVQPAHYLALQGALTAKLRGDLRQKAGWGVAGLYAADAAYRVALDQSPDLAFSSAEIARALGSDPGIRYPALAALATSVARYAALGVQRKLDVGAADPAWFSPERRAAFEALRRAIAALADPGETPPRALLDDVTAFADGLVAVLSAELAAGAPAVPDGTCAAGPRPPGPASLHALARLGDVRRRILLSPRYRYPKGAWMRRTRLVVTLLSDGMDLAMRAVPARGGAAARVRFTIPAAEAEAAVAAALRDWDERELADAIASGYGIGRALLEAPSAERFVEKNGPRLRRVLVGLHGFFRKDAGDPTIGVAMLDALATMPIAEGAGDLSGMLVGYAKAFAARGQHDQRDLWLLSALVVGAIGGGAPPPEAVALATAEKSRVAWVLEYLAEVAKAGRGVAPDPTAYAEKMRSASDDACAKPDAAGVLAVMGAVRDFASGKRSEARAALDRVLDAADARGLSVPRMTYRYEEKTATRVFALSFDISYGAGLLEGPNSFQVGLGIRTRGEPEGAMTVTLAPEDGAKAGEDAARYYVHAAALAAAFHYLEGDAERGAAAARRAIGALSFGVRLGQRAIPGDRPVTWGNDAKALLAIDAVLAAEAGQPFLAGDLWTLVRALLPPDADDAAVAKLLDPLPAGLAAVKDIEPLVARAAKALAVVAAPLPCTDAKVDLGAYDDPSCEAYPLALSFRIADVVQRLPHLRRGGGGAGCAPLRSLDAFLVAAERGTYDPDAFTAAVESLRASGRLYDAAVLLGRQRRDGHCSPAIVGAARALGRAPALGPSLRADLLTVAVNCASATLSDGVVDDLVALDGETRLLPDLGRNLKVVLYVTDLAVKNKRWDLLGRLAAQPDFVERWMKVSPHAATAALVIEHAAAALSGGPAARGARGAGAYTLLCKTFPPGDRAAMCADVAAMRGGGAAEQRKRAARAALERLVAQALGPAPGP